MTLITHGLHHITAIASHAQRNLQFYTETLGLRLVKQTVNYDDPRTYHLYYGDARGQPGSLLTFFIWPDGARGRQGVGQASVVSLAIPARSLAFWVGRLIRRGVRYDGPSKRFDQQVLSFRDPDGLLIELVADERADDLPGWDGAVPAEHTIRGLHSTTLWVDDPQPTAALLTGTLGFDLIGAEEHVQRFAARAAERSTFVDLRTVTGFWEGVVGVGTVHHVALSVADDAAEAALKHTLDDQGIVTTPVLDRTYFRSVYFDAPNGTRFELATEQPGFAVDEPAEALGARLVLPPWLEARRAALEAELPPLAVGV